MNIIAQRTQNNTRASSLADKVANFVLRHGDGLYCNLDIDKIADVVRQHIGYGSLMVVWNKGDIIASVRWNVTNSNTLNVLDLVIHHDYRKRGVLKAMLVNGLQAHPYLKYIKFHRKDTNKDIKCLISDFLGGTHGK